MLYRYRELRRLWECEVYEGDPDDPATTTRTETVIALNAVDANRKVAGRLAKEPVPLHYVTWPTSNDTMMYRIDDPSEGPIGEPIRPTVPLNPEEEEWAAQKVEEVVQPKKEKAPKKPRKSSKKTSTDTSESE